MNKKPMQHQTQTELEKYFMHARNQKCPPSMKKNLYENLQLSNKQAQRWSPKLVVAGLSLVFISSIVFKISTDYTQRQQNILQAQIDLQIAMHYMNRISLKSLSAVNNKGIRPALIKPLSRSMALASL